YSIRSPSGLKVTEVSALIDGRPLEGSNAKGFAPVNAANEAEAKLDLKGLPKRDLTLSLVAHAGDLESTPAIIHLKYQGAPDVKAAPSNATVSLYALLIGVNKFKDPTVPKLFWPAKDARDLADELKLQEGRLYRKVEVKVLTDEDADSNAIIDGLSWLE